MPYRQCTSAAPTPAAAAAAATEPIHSAVAMTGPRCGRHCQTSTAEITASGTSMPMSIAAATKRWSDSLPR